MLPESYLFLESQLVRKSRPQTQRAGGVDYEGGACALGDERVGQANDLLGTVGGPRIKRDFENCRLQEYAAECVRHQWSRYVYLRKFPWCQYSSLGNHIFCKRQKHWHCCAADLY